MNDGDSSKDQQYEQEAAAGKSRRPGGRTSQFSRKRMQETEARAFWNRRASGTHGPDRKAA